MADNQHLAGAKPAPPTVSWRTVAALACLGLAIAYAVVLYLMVRQPGFWTEKKHFLWTTGLIEAGLWPAWALTWLGLYWAVRGVVRPARLRWLAVLAVLLNAVAWSLPLWGRWWGAIMRHYLP